MPEKAAKKFVEKIDAARELILEKNQSNGGLELTSEYSIKILEAIQFHIENCIRLKPDLQSVLHDMVILAVGGFGRMELNLHSDTDLLLLFRDDPNERDEEFIKDFLYPFWEAKLKPSYMIKTVTQAQDEWEDDLDLMTTLMSSRVIWGNEEISDQMISRLRFDCSMSQAEALTEKLNTSVRVRHKKYSFTTSLLEPDLKNSPGALRDIHTIYWLTFMLYNNMDFDSLVDHGIIIRRDRAQINQALSFFLKLRNELHRQAKRDNDKLSVEYQIKIAPELGYEKTENSLPEENLLQDYYERAEIVLRILNRLLKVVIAIQSEESTHKNTRMRGSRIEGHFWMCDHEIWLDSKEVPLVTRDTSWMMHLFITTTMYNLQPTDDTLDLVSQHRHEIDDIYLLAPINRERFLTILRHPVNSGNTLRLMHKSRFLESFIPEFSLIRHLPRIDYYHQFTVDEHLIRAVECCNNYFDENHPQFDSHAGKVAREVLRVDLLNLAILLHDIGKGEGRGHVIRGAHTVQRVCQRLGMRDAETQIVHDLVANHHRLSTATLMRNAEDPGVPQQMAKDIKFPELFKMLYIVTCCDIRGVSDESWNDWKSTLLAQMYERTMNHLIPDRDLRVSREMVYVNLHQIDDKEIPTIKGSAPVPHTKLGIRKFVQDLPNRYQQSTPPEQIVRHFEMLGKISKKRPVVLELETTEESNYSIVHCITRDSPSLFRNVCGALSSRCLQIKSAQVYTGKTGTCIDVYQVQDERGKPPTSQDLIERIEEKLREVVKGEKQVDWVIPTRSKEKPISSDRLSLRPPNVTLFNDESSETYSILEIRSPDKPGLLYEIAEVFERFRIHVHIALVATEGYQVIDVFYVTDWDNNRLVPSPATDALRKELLEVVSPKTTVR